MNTVARLSFPALLFGALTFSTATAQETKPTQGPPAPPQQQPQKQEPEVVEETPEQRMERLKQQISILQKELEYVGDLQKDGGMGKMLVGRLQNRKLEWRSVAAGKSPRITPIGTQATKATLFDDEQKAKYAEDVICTIQGRIVQDKDLAELVDYLKTFASSGTDQQRTTRALMEIIRTEVAHSSFGEQADVAAKTIAEIEDSLRRGVEFAFAAKNRSQGQNAENGGDLGWVTRNSPYGLKLEQVAFATDVKETSGVFRSALGFNLLRVTEKKKGEKPELDQVKVSLITIPYVDDLTEVRQVQAKFAQGNVAMSFRDKELLEMLPPMYR